MKNRFCLAAIILLMPFTAISNGAMLDSAIDLPDEQLCYLAKSTKVMVSAKERQILYIHLR